MRKAVDSKGETRLKLYLAGLSSWYVSLGIQFVMFPFLVTNVLDESAARVGIAQMALMAPSLLFMLLGGAAADRNDVRRTLVRLHLAAAVPALALAFIYAASDLHYLWLIAYALAMGTLGAFAIPARDSGLARVIGSTSMQRAVTLAMSTQLISQLVGMLIAAGAGKTGVVALLGFQSIVMIAGAIATYRLAPMPPTHAPSDGGRLRQVLDGIGEARRVPIIITVVLVMFCVGIFYVGSFLVALPLMVRDVYGLGIVAFSIANMCFWGGTIIATMALLRIGHVARRGRVLVGSLSSGLVILVLFSIPVPFWLLCLYLVIWGMGAGTTMTMGRAIVQTAAPASHRARILSLYQLGFSGGAPIGSVMMGFLAGRLGVHHAMLVPATCVFIVLCLLITMSPLVHYQAREGEA